MAQEGWVRWLAASSLDWFTWTLGTRITRDFIHGATTWSVYTLIPVVAAIGNVEAVLFLQALEWISVACCCCAEVAMCSR